MKFTFCDSDELHVVVTGVGFGLEPERRPSYISVWCIRHQSTVTNMAMVRNCNFMSDSCKIFGIFRHAF